MLGVDRYYKKRVAFPSETSCLDQFCYKHPVTDLVATHPTDVSLQTG
jgi:hypothetical protein